jgi:carbon-monoxide dehydrogenase medium subunit
MYAFEYHKPSSLAEASEIFANSDDPQFLAGGQTLIPVLKQRLAMPSDLIDLSQIEELKGIEASAGSITIGAMTPHADVANSADIRKVLPALADLAGGIGDPHVRNRGTIGGSISNNDPSADYPAAVVGLGATVHTSNREFAADDFFTGLFETALEEGELVTRVTFPVPEAAAYEKFPNPASRYAIAGVMVAKTSDGVRVAVSGAGACVFRVAEMESALEASFAEDALNGISVAADDLNTDLHATAEYRAHLVGVLAKRAVAKIA